MKTEANRLMVLAISTRAAEKSLRESTNVRWYGSDANTATDRNNGLDSLAAIATELETEARRIVGVDEQPREGMRVDPKGMARVLNEAADSVGVLAGMI